MSREALAELLRTNISRPIRFWQTLHRMVDDGARFVVIALAAGILSGCTTNVVARSDDFVVVSAGWGDSLSGLADAFLGDPDKHWVIAEFNKIDRVWPGQQVVIPLRANGSTGQHLRQ